MTAQNGSIDPKVLDELLKDAKGWRHRGATGSGRDLRAAVGEERQAGFDEKVISMYARGTIAPLRNRCSDGCENRS